MGALFAAGWSLDDVLELTWDQLSFVVFSVQSHKVETLTIIQETIVVALGGKLNKKKKRRKVKSEKKKSTDEEKLRALAAMGIPVNQESK